MRVIQEGKLYQLTFMPRAFPVNCYVVEEEEDLTLIDAALPFSVKGILQCSETVGKPIARMVLTHAHSDHIGALDGLKAALPEAKVYISERDARLLRGDRSLDESEGVLPIKGGVPKPGAVKTEPDVLLADGDRVGSLIAVNAAGHTPGSMAFQDGRSGALIAGDAFQTRGGIAVTGQLRLGFPFPALATWNKQAALESARRLAGLAPTLLAVGHGEMVKDPRGVMERAIAEAERKLGI